MFLERLVRGLELHLIICLFIKEQAQVLSSVSRC